VVAHSNVVLHNTATGVEQTAASDDRGEFRFVDVTIGTYELKVTVQGFQSAVAKFELTVGAHQRVDVQLKVAAANSTVTTTAEAAQLETDSSEHGQVVAAREIAALPLNGRNYSQLVELSTGVVPSPATSLITTVRARARSTSTGCAASTPTTCSMAPTITSTALRTRFPATRWCSWRRIR